jgi:hypothetical protein
MDILEFNNHFLNQVIFHAILNDDFLKKIRRKIPLTIFKTREKQTVIKLVYDFFDEWGKAPKDNFYDIFKEYEKSMSSELYDRCINLIGVLKDITGSNPDYVINRIDEGIRHFRLEEASVEFASLIKRRKYDEAKGVILKALKEPSIEEPYYNFFQDTSFIENRLIPKRYKMLTRINKLDEMIGGLRSSWLINILGATKAGKSWFFVEMAVAAILQGLNVLYVSLEMPKEQIDERFDMTMGFMTSSANNNGINLMKKVGDKWVSTVEHDVDNIYEINKVIKNRNKVKKLAGGNLIVQAFNRGRLNWMDIERLMDELEETKGYFTDVLIVDYLGIMKETSANQTKKERIGENCLGLKELSGRKNLITISGMQGNRKAMQAKVFHSYLVADDIDTIFNSDLVLAICQTNKEEKENKCRIYIANSRHGKQHGSVGLIRDLTIGQAALDSFEIKESDLIDDPKDDMVIGSDF